MAVKRNQSVLRALRVLDLIAEHQPVSVSALAEQLDEDRSAVNRMVVTLADAGWIRVAPDAGKQWELTAHLFSIANLPRSDDELRRRARNVLDRLCDEFGETVFLAVPAHRGLVVLDVAQSRHALRMVPRVGEPISPARSSTGRAVLAFLDEEQQRQLLGRPPGAPEKAEYAEVRGRGFATSVDDIMQGAANVAAPVFDARGRVIAAIALSGPTGRLDADRLNQAGEVLARLAKSV